MKRYFLHLLANWNVAFTAFLLFLLHFLHGLIPVKHTSHEYWGIRINAKSRLAPTQVKKLHRRER
jgi:hypothetical protein